MWDSITARKQNSKALKQMYKHKNPNQDYTVDRTLPHLPKKSILIRNRNFIMLRKMKKQKKTAKPQHPTRKREERKLKFN